MQREGERTHASMGFAVSPDVIYVWSEVRTLVFATGFLEKVNDVLVSEVFILPMVLWWIVHGSDAPNTLDTRLERGYPIMTPLSGAKKDGRSEDFGKRKHRRYGQAYG